MGYKKVLKTLNDKSLVDRRELFCYSNANITRSADHIIYTKYTTERQDKLPRFMILSLKDDKLHISSAKMMGGFKKYFNALEISKLTFLGNSSKDFIDTYQFSYDLGEGKTMEFRINSSYKKNLTRRFVDELNIQLKKIENLN